MLVKLKGFFDIAGGLARFVRQAHGQRQQLIRNAGSRENSRALNVVRWLGARPQLGSRRLNERVLVLWHPYLGF